LEDPGFLSHTGVISQAFENSLIDNLKLGKFYRGGSTITMQLAKNLWLSRDKTLGRKIQEVFLAQAIESCYTKDEILELYLNVVEMGPSIYGLQAGTKHWFDKDPMQLNFVEAFWMASVLPRPRTAVKPKDFASTRRLIEQLTGEVVHDDESTPVDLSEWVAQ
ncbi:MAG: biosynthetic peptidoglycan transglycosylase, partial [Parcubacteria group bacterium]